MHIIHVYDGHEQIYDGRGSLPRIIWNIARRTAKRGHDVSIIERQWANLNRESIHQGVRFRRLELRTGSTEPWSRVPYEEVQHPSGLIRLIGDRINFALHTQAALRKLDFDVIHTYLPFAANVLALTSRGLRNRMVYTAQLGELRLNALSDTDDAELDAPAILKRFSPDIFLAKRATRTTVLNEHVRDIFARNGVHEHRLTHVPNGVEYEKFQNIDSAERSRVREKFGLDERPTVLFVGTVMPRKGVLQLVEAARSITESRDIGFQLVIAGETDLDPEYLNRVKSIIRGSSLEERTVFTGYLEDHDLIPLYAESDVFVLPSFEEGFGMVVSEAMAAGTPVVASDINGVRQQVKNGETGLLVEPGDERAIESALYNLLNDRAKRERMGRASRSYAERFSWETITDQYIEIYERLLSGP